MVAAQKIVLRCKWCGSVIGDLSVPTSIVTFRGRCPDRGCRMWLEIACGP